MELDALQIIYIYKSRKQQVESRKQNMICDEIKRHLVGRFVNNICTYESGKWKVESRKWKIEYDV